MGDQFNAAQVFYFLPAGIPFEDKKTMDAYLPVLKEQDRQTDKLSREDERKVFMQWWDGECERGKRPEDPAGTFFALTSLLHNQNVLRDGKAPWEGEPLEGE